MTNHTAPARTPTPERWQDTCSEVEERNYPGSRSTMGESTAQVWLYEGTGSASGIWCWQAWHCSGHWRTGSGLPTRQDAFTAAENWLFPSVMPAAA